MKPTLYHFTRLMFKKFPHQMMLCWERFAPWVQYQFHRSLACLLTLYKIHSALRWHEQQQQKCNISTTFQATVQQNKRKWKHFLGISCLSPQGKYETASVCVCVCLLEHFTFIFSINWMHLISNELRYYVLSARV